MIYYLENEIRLIEKDEDWFLQEFDKDGNKIGGEKIPWEWGLWFTASELEYSCSIEILGESLTDKSVWVQGDEEFITATLRPGTCSADKYLIDDKVTYSMFGTNRTINEFYLHISKGSNDTENDDEKFEMCGGVSYTSDTYFEYETKDDWVEINLCLSPEQFYMVVEAIKCKHINILQISLGHVAGFYSEWSPSISTDEIKVLADLKCQKIITRDGCQIDPPTLGKTGKCNMRLVQHQKFNLKENI